jgi:hypothetical protein
MANPTATLSIYGRGCLGVGELILHTAVLYLRLMKTGFTFDQDTTAPFLWSTSNFDSWELSGVNGYTTGGQALAGATPGYDTTLHRYYVAFNSVAWTATGGNIGPTPGAILEDKSEPPGGGTARDRIIGYLDFGGDQTQLNGGVFTIATPIIKV